MGNCFSPFYNQVKHEIVSFRSKTIQLEMSFSAYYDYKFLGQKRKAGTERKNIKKIVEELNCDLHQFTKSDLYKECLELSNCNHVFVELQSCLFHILTLVDKKNAPYKVANRQEALKIKESLKDLSKRLIDIKANDFPEWYKRLSKLLSFKRVQIGQFSVDKNNNNNNNNNNDDDDEDGGNNNYNEDDDYEDNEEYDSDYYDEFHN